MIINCKTCNKEFNSTTNSKYCNDECREIGRNKMNALKAKKYREAHKHEELYKIRKKRYDTKILHCISCNQEHSIIMNGKKKTDLCEKCYMKSILKCTDMAKRAKTKANTSGYIGVYAVKKTWNKDEYWGVLSLIDHNKITIMRNKYKDSEMHEKTFIQAAVDRDIFILQNNLPHERNFTDNELEAKMFFLGYEELSKIKEKIIIPIGLQYKYNLSKL